MRGPRGEYRPADAIGCAVMVAKIATGEIEEVIEEGTKQQIDGSKGGHIRAKKLSPERRKEIASKAAKARWEKKES